MTILLYDLLHFQALIWEREWGWICANRYVCFFCGFRR